MPKSLDEIFGGQDASTQPSAPARKSLDSIFGGEQPKPEVSQLESGLRGAYKGATANFGDEIQAAGGALVGYAADKLYGNKDRSLADNYNDAIKLTRKAEQEARESNPDTYLAGQVAGTIATGVGAGATKAGQAVTNSLRTGNAGARIVKGAATGAVSGGVYGAGEGEGKERLKSAGLGAVYGGVTGGVIPAVGAVVKPVLKEVENVYKGFKAPDVEALQSASKSIKDTSSAAYQSMRNSNATLNRSAINTITANVGKEVNSVGKLNSRLHGDTLSVLEDFNNASSSGSLGLDELDQYRQLFGQVVKKNTSKIDGANPDALVAQKAINAIDDAVENLKPGQLNNNSQQAIDALTTARAEWSRYKKFDRVVNIIDKSEGDANYIKRELRKLYVDKKATAGWTDAERASLKEASSLSTSEGILKSLGKFGFDIGAPSRIGNTALPVGGIALGQPGLTAAGTVARQAQKYVARGKTNDLLNVIQDGAGAASKPAATNPLINASAGAINATEQTHKPLQIGIRPNANTRYVPDSSVKPASAKAVSPRSEVTNDLVNKMVKAESNGDPNAKSKTSSASGLLQFTNQTWRDVVNKHGKELGITYADKNDPEAQIKAGKKLAEDNTDYLLSKLGRQPTDGEVYIAHFLGAPKAGRLIARKGSTQDAASIFPKEAKVNKAIFYSNGKPRTVAEVYQLLTNKVA